MFFSRPFGGSCECNELQRLITFFFTFSILAQHDEILQFIGRNKQDFGDLQDKGIRWAVQAEVPLYLQLLEIVVDEQANGPRRAKWAAALMSNQKGAKDAQNKIRRKIIYVLRGETNYRYEGKLKETLLADFKRKDRGKRCK